MRSPWGRHGALTTAALLVTALLATPLVTAASSPGPAAAAARGGAGRAAVVAVPQRQGKPGTQFARHPLLVRVRGYAADGRPLLAASAPGGYTPAELRGYLRLHAAGSGQRVAIVDAFDDPYASADINAYSAQFGLPRTCTKTRTAGCFRFTVTHPYGIGGLDPGWALEESLDVDMIHAIAPRASIVLVEAHDNSNGAMFRALSYAASLHPVAISNSWTLGGEIAGESGDDHYCRLTAGVCVFATGDAGNPGGYPAYNPAVIAVGGTSLELTAAGAVGTETAWSSSGGGVSSFEPRPAYQNRVSTLPNRGIPDVSFDADPATGVAVYASADGGWLEVGGTSVGAPAWAAIIAAADQLRKAGHKGPLTAARYEAQQALYHLRSGLHDVTSGSNGSCGAVCTAGPGYDFVTGLGSPRRGIDTALAAAR